MTWHNITKRPPPESKLLWFKTFQGDIFAGVLYSDGYVRHFTQPDEEFKKTSAFLLYAWAEIGEEDEG